MQYRIGQATLDLTVLGAGIHGGRLPADGRLEVRLTPDEVEDLEAFVSTGWQFVNAADLDWLDVQKLNPEPLRAGLLARQRDGGLVVLQDLLNVFVPKESDATDLLRNYAQWWQPIRALGGFEVQLKLPARELERAIHDKLLSLQAGGVVAEPSLLYRVRSPGTATAAKLNDWPSRAINLQDAWDDGSMGEGMRVAVIDRGFFNPSKKPVWTTAWEVSLDQNGEVTGTKVPADSHGTECASVLAAYDDGKNVTGVLPKAELILVTLPPCASQAALGKALELCATGTHRNGTFYGEGAHVISCSLVGSGTTWLREKVLCASIDLALSQGRGGKLGTPIAWATRDFNLPLDPNCVQAYKPLLAVSAADRNGNRAGSEYGSGLGLIAPGVGIAAASWAVGETSVKVVEATGSSVATPFAAGVLALVAALRPDDEAAEIIKVVTDTCHRKKGNGWYWDYGWGLLDAAAAVTAATPGKAVKALQTGRNASP